MDTNSDEYRQLVAHHLSVLTAHGREYSGQIMAAVQLLQADLDGGVSLSDRDKADLLSIILNSAQKHINMLDWTVEERKNFGAD